MIAVDRWPRPRLSLCVAAVSHPPAPAVPTFSTFPGSIDAVNPETAAACVTQTSLLAAAAVASRAGRMEMQGGRVVSQGSLIDSGDGRGVGAGETDPINDMHKLRLNPAGRGRLCGSSIDEYVYRHLWRSRVRRVRQLSQDDLVSIAIADQS